MRVQTAGDAMSVLELPLMNKNTSVQDAFNDFVTTDYSAVVIKTSKVLSVLLVCVLAACNSSAPPPAPPAAATISNLTVFLVQGTPEQKSIDQVTYRKHDYPLPNGYQVDDSVLLPDGRILQTFALVCKSLQNATIGEQYAVIDLIPIRQRIIVLSISDLVDRLLLGRALHEKHCQVRDRRRSGRRWWRG